LTLTLWADGAVVTGATPTWAKTGNTWTYTYSNLPKYNDSHVAITYAVTESVPAGYEKISTDNGRDFTNTIKQAYKSISGSKTWIDPLGTNHDTITINLLQGTTVYSSVTLANGETAYEFGKDEDGNDTLPVYDLATGQPYVYTVEEVNVPGYTTTFVGSPKVSSCATPATGRPAAS
jgi:hypothetical protein